MNKLVRNLVLIGWLFFIIIHYLIMDITKAHFPIFAYLYPFIGKFWFETGRLLLYLNAGADLTSLFSFVKLLLLANIATTLFAFKYPIFYRITLYFAAFFLISYLIGMMFLGLLTIYPIYIIMILCILFIFIALIYQQIKTSHKNNS